MKAKLLNKVTPSNEKYNSYNSLINYSARYNRAIFKVFSEYFNILKENKKLQRQHNVKIIGFLDGVNFTQNVRLGDILGCTFVLIEFEGLLLNLAFDAYKENGELVHYLGMSSNKVTTLSSSHVYKTLFHYAINTSDLKGKYLTIKSDSLSWIREDLEVRNFNDIFLPSSVMEDLKLFVQTKEQNDLIMRYLMVGTPGCAKTESTLVLANELNKLGVTIIATPVCETIKEKVELATMLASSLLIFDDVDLSLGSRSGGGFNAGLLQLFLSVLDGCEKMNKNVGIIATTNSARLLDLAAQRPGRFDKTLLFDELTKDNVKNIIIKSLRVHFELDINNDKTKIFTDPFVVNLFHEKQVTGAAIYNSAKMLYLRAKTLNIEITTKWIISEVEKELKIMEKIRKSDFLTDKMGKGENKIGFNSDYNEADLGNEVCEKITYVGKSSGHDKKEYK